MKAESRKQKSARARWAGLDGVTVPGVSKAALKRPHSKRWRAELDASEVAKRLECGRFSAAFETPRTVAQSKPAQRARADFCFLLSAFIIFS